MHQEPTPQQSLDALKRGLAARHALADVAARPPWIYLALFGAGAGLLVASQGLPHPWNLFAAPAAFAGLAVAMRWWRKRFGWWVDGFAPRRAGRVAFVTAVLLVALMLAALWSRERGMDWSPPVLGVLAAIITMMLGRGWMQAWRRDLNELSA
jgi:hypothetical protein